MTNNINIIDVEKNVIQQDFMLVHHDKQYLFTVQSTKDDKEDFKNKYNMTVMHILTLNNLRGEYNVINLFTGKNKKYTISSNNKNEFSLVLNKFKKYIEMNKYKEIDENILIELYNDILDKGNKYGIMKDTIQSYLRQYVKNMKNNI